jgi:beta-glucosidase
MPNERSQTNPLWRNPDAAPGERVSDLLERLTLEEKIALLDNLSPAIERLGLKKFKYGGEALHGLCNTGRATSFPMPVGLAATFDDELIEKVAAATADEMRAKYHSKDWKDSPRVTLQVWSPVINILRDPRWGRAQETYGEDPFLTGVMGRAYVRGLQGDDPRMLKLAACAKHLGVHSGPESLRTRFNSIVSRKDLFETYLYAFGELVEENVASVMATYNRVNGEHCCAHSVMIGEFLRTRLGYDGVILSDGDALSSLHKKYDLAPDGTAGGRLKDGHNLTEDVVETAGLCLQQQLDFELGTHALRRAKEAIDRGLISEAEIDRAARRVLEMHCKVGFLDADDSANPYAKTDVSVINCAAHVELALEAARKSVVLLKNESDTLPLRKERDKVVLVTGPASIDLQILLGNFYKGSGARLVSILEGITGSAPEGVTVTHSQGAFLTHPNVFESTWYLGLTDWADAVVACVGFSPLMEGEQGECIGAADGGDKSSIALPAHQLDYLRRIRTKIDANPRKPKLIVVVTGGCPLELEEVAELADAMLMAWYPGEQGGNAVGDIIWGKTNPSGKLSATFPQRLTDLPPYENYALKGRTYRYMETAPLYPFGYGLSYTQFKTGPLAIGAALNATVEVSNVGEIPGEAVVQLYARWTHHPDAPQCALVGFKRVNLGAGETATLCINLKTKNLIPIGEDGLPIPGKNTVELAACQQAPVDSIAGGTNHPQWVTIQIG